MVIFTSRTFAAVRAMMCGFLGREFPALQRRRSFFSSSVTVAVFCSW